MKAKYNTVCAKRAAAEVRVPLLCSLKKASYQRNPYSPDCGIRAIRGKFLAAKVEYADEVRGPRWCYG